MCVCEIQTLHSRQFFFSLNLFSPFFHLTYVCTLYIFFRIPFGLWWYLINCQKRQDENNNSKLKRQIYINNSLEEFGLMICWVNAKIDLFHRHTKTRDSCILYVYIKHSFCVNHALHVLAIDIIYHLMQCMCISLISGCESGLATTMTTTTTTINWARVFANVRDWP